MGQIVSVAAKPKRCNIQSLSQLGTPAAGEYILVSSDDSMNEAGQGNFDCFIIGDGTTAATELEIQKINGDFYNKVTVPTFTVESGFYKEDKNKYSGNGYTCAIVDVSNLVGYRLKISSFVLSADVAAKTFFIDSNAIVISTWNSSQGKTMVVPNGAVSLYISNKTTASNWNVTLDEVVFINKIDVLSNTLSSIDNRLDSVDEQLYYSPTVPEFTINTGSYYRENLSKASHGSFSCAKINVENLNGFTLKISPFTLSSSVDAKTSFVDSNGGVLATWHSGEGNTHIVPNGAVLLYASNRTTDTWTVTLVDNVKLSKIEGLDNRVTEIEDAIESGQIGGGGGGAITEYTILESTSFLPSTAEANKGYIINGDLWLYTTTGWQNLGAFRGPKGDTGEPGPQGIQGNSGVSDASTAELVNNLEDGGQTKFLSAEMGKSLGTYSRYNNKNYKICCFGDSITSNQVVNVGGVVRSILNMSTLTEDTADGNASYVNAVGNVTTDFGNLACGNATLTDYWSNGVNATTIRLLKSDNVFGHSGSGYNVLSNQVRRLLWHTTASDSTIQWTDYNNVTHYIYELDNTLYEGTSIPTGATGVAGKGYTSDIPNLIYIAIGTNDRNSSTFENDDVDATFSETYANLTRRTFSSALRWAIETLQIVYPSATIAVATPLHRTTSAGVSLVNQNLKAQLIKDVCKKLGVAVIDEFSSSGIGQNSLSWLTQDGTHPNSDGKRVVSRFVAGQLLSIFGVLR